ncbi:hypothetical protein [Lysobacter sp. HA18]
MTSPHRLEKSFAGACTELTGADLCGIKQAAAHFGLMRTLSATPTVAWLSDTAFWLIAKRAHFFF